MCGQVPIIIYETLEWCGVSKVENLFVNLFEFLFSSIFYFFINFLQFVEVCVVAIL